MGDFNDAFMRNQNAAVQARTKAQNRANVLQLKLVCSLFPDLLFPPPATFQISSFLSVFFFLILIFIFGSCSSVFVRGFPLIFSKPSSGFKFLDLYFFFFRFFDLVYYSFYSFVEFGCGNWVFPYVCIYQALFLFCSYIICLLVCVWILVFVKSSFHSLIIRRDCGNWFLEHMNLLGNFLVLCVLFVD